MAFCSGVCLVCLTGVVSAQQAIEELQQRRAEKKRQEKEERERLQQEELRRKHKEVCVLCLLEGFGG